jgi:hypothetical protein
MIIGDSDAALRMRAHVEAFGCTINSGESMEMEEALSGDTGLGSVSEIVIADAAPTYLIGEQGDVR